MNKATIVSTSAIALLIAGLSFNAFASSGDREATAEARKNAAISLAQAISIAEQATGGKNAEAEFELDDGVALYEVEIKMPDGSEVDVDVDATSGAILAQKAEKDKHDKDCDDDKKRHHKDKDDGKA